MSKKNNVAATTTNTANTTNAPVMGKIKENQKNKENSGNSIPKRTKTELEAKLGVRVSFIECIDPEGKEPNYLMAIACDSTRKVYEPSNPKSAGREFMNAGYKLDEEDLKELIDISTDELRQHVAEYSHCRIGWGEYNSQTIFKLQQVALANGTMESTYTGNQPIGQAGSKVAYLNGIKELVAPYPKLFIAYAVGFTGILSQQLSKADANILVALCGKRGRGKTTVTRLMFSAWGDPNDLLMTYNATENKWEEDAANRVFLPTSIDDILAGKINLSPQKVLQAINDIIFRASMGKSKDRYGKSGRRYFGGTLVSAESSIIETQQGAANEGQLFRIIELSIGDNDLTEDADHAKQIERLVKRNYGFAADDFGAYLLAKGFMGYTLEDMYDDICEELVQDERVQAEPRIANRLGLLLLTIQLLNDCFELQADLKEIKDILIESALAPFRMVRKSDIMYNRFLQLAKDEVKKGDNGCFICEQDKYIKSKHIGVLCSDGVTGAELIIPSDRIAPLFIAGGTLEENDMKRIINHCNINGGYTDKNKRDGGILKQWRNEKKVSTCESGKSIFKKLKMGDTKDTSVYVISYPTFDFESFIAEVKEGVSA